MTTIAEIKLWGRTIGAVSMADETDVAVFEYDPDFADSGIKIAPLTMPPSRRIYTFPELPRQTFHGLPGLLADSLPDRFGNALIDAWLRREGKTPASFNAIERLCYIGSRGMGALEFEPSRGPQARKANRIQVDRLVELASQILTERENLRVSLDAPHDAQAMTDILKVGTSAGGARAKAVIAWHPATKEVRSGQIQAGDGFEYWILKFDGVSGNRDKELEDPKGYGAIEYAYARMATDAGIRMNPCRLLEENDRRHFMTKRFDRTENGQKLHMQSLCAMAHMDFNMAGAYSYEQAIQVVKQLDLPMSAVEALFRRMTFNIVARNQDDHVKNIAFLMDKQGRWSLSPAFDMTYSYNPTGDWTASHQMTMNGKRQKFSIDDFEACAKNASMKRGRARAIVNEVTEVVERWQDYAEAAGVFPTWRDEIQKHLRLKIA